MYLKKKKNYNIDLVNDLKICQNLEFWLKNNERFVSMRFYPLYRLRTKSKNCHYSNGYIILLSKVLKTFYN